MERIDAPIGFFVYEREPRLERRHVGVGGDVFAAVEAPRPGLAQRILDPVVGAQVREGEDRKSVV